MYTLQPFCFRYFEHVHCTVTTRVVFLYRALVGIASYTEQNLAIRSRLYGVEYFCYSEQIIRGRLFLLFRVGHTEQAISAIPSRLYGVDYFCYSEQVIRSRLFLLFRVEYFCCSEQAIRSRLFLLFQNGKYFTKFYLVIFCCIFF